MRRLFPVALVAAALVLSACSSLRPYAALVNGERISQADVEAELDAILASPSYLRAVSEGFRGPGGETAVGAGPRTFSTAFVAALLDRRIGFELIDQEVRRRNLPVTEADRAEAGTTMDEQFGAEVLAELPSSYTAWLTRSFANVVVLRRALAGTTSVTDEDVRRFYEANQAAFADQACARHILVATQAEAAAVRARIDGGEDFAAVARAESTDRNGPDGGSAAQGGDLGCTPRGTFVAEFQAALDGLAVGQVSEPVQTQFGFHIIQLQERRTIPLEEVAPRIRAQLEQQAGSRDAVGRFVTMAVRTADITVNPRYGSFDTGDEPGVKPPPAPGATAGARDLPLPVPPAVPAPTPTPTP